MFLREVGFAVGCSAGVTVVSEDRLGEENGFTSVHAVALLSDTRSRQGLVAPQVKRRPTGSHDG